MNDRRLGKGKPPAAAPEVSLSGEKPTRRALGGDSPEAFGSAAQPTPPGFPSPHRGAPLAESGWRIGRGARWTHNRTAFPGSQVAQSSDFEKPHFTRVFAVNTTLSGDTTRKEVAEK
jgi:hypothetical protein